MSYSPPPSRAVPAFVLCACALAFAWVYSIYTEGQSVPAASFVLPPVAALALGGLVDPRVLWAVGPRRAELPPSLRVVGAIVFAVGLAISAALLVWAPRP